MDQFSVLLRGRRKGAHVHVDVFAGQRGQRALTGTIVLRPEEWSVVNEGLLRVDANTFVKIEAEDVSDAVEVRPHDDGCAFPINHCVCEGPRRAR